MSLSRKLGQCPVAAASRTQGHQRDQTIERKAGPETTGLPVGEGLPVRGPLPHISMHIKKATG